MTSFARITCWQYLFLLWVLKGEEVNIQGERHGSSSPPPHTQTYIQARPPVCFMPSLIPAPPMPLWISLFLARVFTFLFISLLVMLTYFSPRYRFSPQVSTIQDHYIYFLRTLLSQESPSFFFSSFVQVGVRRKQRSVSAKVTLKVASPPLARHRITSCIFLTLFLRGGNSMI